MKQVVITGIGVISAAGATPKALFDACVEGKSGIREIKAFDASKCKSRIAGQVDLGVMDGFLGKKESSRLDRATRMGMYAALTAIEDAGLSDADGSCAGVFIGTAAGCLTSLEVLHYTQAAGGPPDVMGVPMAMNHAPAANISMKFGLQGPTLTFSTACSSGAAAFAVAALSVAGEESEWAITGGVDASLTLNQLRLWGSLRIMSSSNSDPEGAIRPFCRTRDGIVLAEGACVMALETAERARARGARIYAEIAGWGMSADTFHITQPNPAGQAVAIRRCLKAAHVAPSDVEYINAHGTATPHNDKAETEAVKLAFGRDCPPMSSIKPITGHMLGASSAAEIAVTAIALDRQMIPPTINYREADPECDLDYVVTGAREMKLKTAMSNSFAFGGQNVSVLLRRCA